MTSCKLEEGQFESLEGLPYQKVVDGIEEVNMIDGGVVVHMVQVGDKDADHHGMEGA